MDITVIPSAVTIDVFFVDVANETNRSLWGISEQINEVRWILPRSTKWWMDNLWRVIDHSAGAGYTSIVTGSGATLVTTTTCRIPDGAGAVDTRYVRGYMGAAPDNRYSVLPHIEAKLHGYTYLYDPTTSTTTAGLEYDNGLIKDQTTTQVYPSTRVFSSESYTGGKENGTFTYHYDDAAEVDFWWQGPYVNGLPNGTWIEHNVAGAILQTVSIVNGIVQ